MREGHFKSCPDPTDCWCEVRRISYILYIAGAIISIQVTAGFFAKSMALFADAGHTAFDSIAAFVTLFAAVLVRFGAEQEKASGKAFTINIVLLFLAICWIVFEASERLLSAQQEAVGIIMFFAGLVGLVGNFIQYHILSGAAPEHKHDAHESLALHYLSDMMVSGGVIVGGILIHLTGIQLIDPLLSYGIAAWILWQAIRLVRNRVA